MAGRKVVCVVCGPPGGGGAPDAADCGDEGADTLAHASAAAGGVRLPSLGAIGLGHLTRVAGVPPAAAPTGVVARLVERSAAKDTTTGHWEMMGVVSERPPPLYPDGFPPEVIGPFSAAIGRGVLGNRPASGTQIIKELGDEHVATGRPIVYTSGDSVFQIAAHKRVVPLEQLYHWCRAARGLLTGEHAVGRVIARPFEGPSGDYRRTTERLDYALAPPGPTVLQALPCSGASRTPGCAPWAAARSRTSSPGGAWRTPATPATTTPPWTPRPRSCGRPTGPRSCSPTWSTSTWSTATGATPPGTPPAWSGWTGAGRSCPGCWARSAGCSLPPTTAATPPGGAPTTPASAS